MDHIGIRQTLLDRRLTAFFHAGKVARINNHTEILTVNRFNQTDDTDKLILQPGVEYVQESYTNYSAKMLVEGTTVLSKAEYRFAMELVSQAQGGNYSGCDEAVYKLLYLDRINNGVIQEETQECVFIT